MADTMVSLMRLIAPNSGLSRTLTGHVLLLTVLGAYVAEIDELGSVSSQR